MNGFIGPFRRTTILIISPSLIVKICINLFLILNMLFGGMGGEHVGEHANFRSMYFKTNFKGTVRHVGKYTYLLSC